MTTGPFNPMDMKSLLCFAMMAKHGSLTRAGIELGISDSAVSQRVRSLERHLGTKLYEARGGKVRLTEAGRRTMALAFRIFDQVAELEEDIRDHEFCGTITLGAAAPVIRHQLTDILGKFRENFPNAALRLLSQPTIRTQSQVRRNDIDIGIIPLQPNLPPDLVFHPWRTFRAFVLVPKNHPLAMRRAPTIEDILNKDTLTQFPQVVTTLEDGESDRVREGLKRLGLPFNVALEVGDLDNVKHYAANGHGLAAVNGVCLASEDAKMFHLIEIPDELGGTVTYGVILYKEKYQSQALRRLLELLGVSSDKQHLKAGATSSTGRG